MSNRTKAQLYARWLMVFLSLFIFRVCAQLIQALHPLPFLPPFESWQSGTLPYPLLVVFQFCIIIYCMTVIGKFRSGTISPCARSANIYLLLGGFYFLVMLFRLLVGLSFAREHPWFSAHIPSVFHLILAAFLLTVGLFHSNTAKIVPWLAYPAVIISAVAAHSLSIHYGINLQIATYGPVLFGALAITYLERTFPHREEWFADRDDLLTDSTYMLVVQIILPTFLSFFVAITLLRYLTLHGMTFDSLWPHSWPIYAQAFLMLITAEFMRYWVHRLAHQWNPLWQFHAVHHSPHKLYWMNVGRFHPLEKALQYLFDALPFIVLAVSEEVLAIYFVFYAINGFFQHCNIELRLGWLNYLISGPELHRWHHSMLLRESNRNYGNNLIIWDLLFGTWFLPKDRLVGDLGLINRKYPMSFAKQLKTPLIKGLDKAAK